MWTLYFTPQAAELVLHCLKRSIWFALSLQFYYCIWHGRKFVSFGMLVTNNVRITATAYPQTRYSMPLLYYYFSIFALLTTINFIHQNFGPNWRRANDVRWQINPVNKVQYDRLLHFKRVFSSYFLMAHMCEK